MCMLDLILVIIERMQPSVPFRTRQGKTVSPMVLWLKPRKSRSSPELNPDKDIKTEIIKPLFLQRFLFCLNTSNFFIICRFLVLILFFSIILLLGHKDQHISVSRDVIFVVVQKCLRHLRILTNLLFVVPMKQFRF